MQKPAKHKPFRMAAPKHTSQIYDRHRANTPGLREAGIFRSSNRWKLLRLAFISRHPVCANPHGYHVEFSPAAAEVHHVASLQARPDLAFDPSNLMALCRVCHAKFSQEERRT
jgi:5-methylcytosine-specific restriction endonuclease McrA